MSPRPPAARDAALTGILWMVASGLSFVGVTAIVRHLGTDLPAAQSAFLRFLFGLLLLSPALLAALRAGIPPAARGPLVLRGVLHTAAVVFWFYAMARIPVAEVTAIGFLNPVVVTLGGIFLFRERLSAVRLAAIGVALLGALVVLRPGFREVLPGHLSQLAAALSFGMSYLVAKRLAPLMPAGALVALLSLTVSLGLLPLALAVWVPPTGVQLAWLALVAVFASMGHYCMARAFAVAPLAATQPVVFLQLVWASLLGAFVFAEPVDPFVIAGGGTIIAAVSLLAWREAQGRRAAAEAETA